MDNIYVESRTGTHKFDFEANTITIKRNSGWISSTLALTDYEIFFYEITGIEIRKPTMMKLGSVKFIVNDKRQIAPMGGNDATEAIPKSKSEFTKIEEAIKRLKEYKPDIEIRDENGFNVETEIYYKEPTEYRKRCQVCGNIFCYTDQDLKRNRSNAFVSGLSAISTIANAVGGTAYSMFESNKVSQNAASKVIDYNKCPKCGSTNLVMMSEEDFKKEQNKVETSAPVTVSSADELKKYKDLLDSGIITQEEFDAKKKQILGL